MRLGCMRDLILEIEEHVLALQQEDVRTGLRTHERTIALLRALLAEQNQPGFDDGDDTRFPPMRI